MSVAAIYDQAGEPVIEVYDVHRVDDRPVAELVVGPIRGRYDRETGGVSRYEQTAGPITPKEAARRKGCDVNRVRDAIADGSLEVKYFEGVPGVKRGLLDVDAIDAWAPPVREIDRRLAAKAAQAVQVTARADAEAAANAAAKAAAAEEHRQAVLAAAGTPVAAADGAGSSQRPRRSGARKVL